MLYDGTTNLSTLKSRLKTLPFRQAFSYYYYYYFFFFKFRYNLHPPNLPSYCACGEVFTVNHALTCKKGGFIAQRHDTIQDLLTSHISKVCRNVEPLLQPLHNEVFNLQSTVMSREARLDMKAGGFWTPGVTAFVDVRVTHINSWSNQGKHIATICT